MGTTLTGLTPATTYDALIKVTDNGPLSATAKRLSDGLGNDSVVALSTSSVGIGTTGPTQLLHVDGNVRITGALYDGNNAAGTSGQILSSTGTATDWVSKSDLGLVDGSGTANFVSKWSDTDTLTNSLIFDNGTNVGIGTASPASKLHLVGGTISTSISDVATTTTSRFDIANPAISLGIGYVAADIPMLQSFNNTNNTATNLTINPFGGNVGIGTSAPTSKLQVESSNPTTGILTSVRNTALSAQSGALMTFTQQGIADWGIGQPAASNSFAFFAGTFSGTLGTEIARFQPTGGISFNGDTAAANALDDYEEGTWTPTDASGAGLTLTTAVGSYTKIGREVFYRAFIQYPSTVDVNNATLGGLPFTVANTNSARSGNVTYTDEATLVYAFSTNNTTSVALYTNVGGFVTNAVMSGNLVFIVGNYYV